MVLSELHELIETLQARIDAHRSAFQQNEALTRYALIDPLLRGLGWDTSNPSQVLVEFRSQSGSADYALLGDDGRPRVIVEAKKLGTPLAGAVRQLIGYCIEDGIEFCVLTDGQSWELYRTFDPVPLNQKLVVKLDLAGESSETCLKALALWRPSVAVGSVQVGATPIVETPATVKHPHQTPAPLPATRTPLSQLSVEKGSSPSAIGLPSGDVLETSKWTELATTIVSWLVDQHHLNDSHLPILGGKRRYLIAAQPLHPTGKPFVLGRQIGQYFIETNYSANNQIANMRRIIEHVGLNSADFAVQVRE